MKTKKSESIWCQRRHARHTAIPLLCKRTTSATLAPKLPFEQTWRPLFVLFCIIWGVLHPPRKWPLMWKSRSRKNRALGQDHTPVACIRRPSISIAIRCILCKMLRVCIYKFEGDGNRAFSMLSEKFMSKMELEASKALTLTSRSGRWGVYLIFGDKGEKLCIILKKQKQKPSI